MHSTQQGTKWFSNTKATLNKQTLLSELKIKVIVTEAITYFLIDDINFSMFLTIINLVEKKQDITINPELNQSVTNLLSLSKYKKNPQNYRNEIIEILNEVINKILKK